MIPLCSESSPFHFQAPLCSLTHYTRETGESKGKKMLFQNRKGNQHSDYMVYMKP